MNNLTIEQYCKLETLKTDLESADFGGCKSGCKYEEKVKDNVTVLEVTDFQGNLIKELIVVL